MGYSKKFVQERFDEIVDFSGLRSFIDIPLKNYSSGMRSRLGFAIATQVDPDILILDEVLAVGDKDFHEKSEQKILEMMDRGATVLFVSHSMEQVERICNKAILLENGRIVASGSVSEVQRVYQTRK